MAKKKNKMGDRIHESGVRGIQVAINGTVSVDPPDFREGKYPEYLDAFDSIVERSYIKQDTGQRSKVLYRKLPLPREGKGGREVKTQYEYINFKLKEKKPKTKVWSCRNNNSFEELGVVKWFPAWRRYCYFPVIQAVYSRGCLNDISTFIEAAMQERSGTNDSG